MNRESIPSYLAETYGAEPDFPWESNSNTMVFRHRENEKWFAVVLEVSKEKIGLKEAGTIDLLNVKCDPLMIGSMQQEPGVYPAYHMNKSHWLSIALDGSAEESIIKLLIDISFDLTVPKRK